MSISMKKKTKSLVISKDPIRYKLSIENQPIDQVMSVNYLGIQISASQDRSTKTS